MKYFVAGLELAELALEGTGAQLAGGAVADAAAVAAAAARAGRAPRDLLADLARRLAGPVVVDVGVPAGALEVARAFAEPGGPVVVRVPFGDEGRATIRAGVAAGLRMAAIGCATPAQVLQAAEAGATWISPTVGLPPAGAALDEAMATLRKAVALLKSSDSQAQLLVGPVLDASVLIDVAFAGAHAATVPVALLREISRPLAARGGAGSPVGR
jgi:hypothetical protein